MVEECENSTGKLVFKPIQGAREWISMFETLGSIYSTVQLLYKVSQELYLKSLLIS